MTEETSSISFEPIKRCPVCRSERARVSFAEVEDYLCSLPGKFRYVQCRDCQLVYQNPRPIVAHLPKCYPNYHAQKEKPLEESFSGPWNWPTGWIRGGILARKFGYRHLAPSTLMSFLACGVDVLPLIRSRARCGLGTGSSTSLPVFSGAGRALDVGAGNCYYAAKLARLGWRVTAVDFDAATAATSANREHVTIYSSTLEQANLTAESFEFVSMFHVIEHLPDPLGTLRECHRLMTQNGRLMIRTPNYDSITRRSFGQYWRGLEAPRHLCIFNSDALQRALRMAGFRVTKITTTPGATPYSVRSSVRFRNTKTGRRESEVKIGLLVKYYDALARVGRWTRELLGDELHIEALKR